MLQLLQTSRQDLGEYVSYEHLLGGMHQIHLFVVELIAHPATSQSECFCPPFSQVELFALGHDYCGATITCESSFQRQMQKISQRMHSAAKTSAIASTPASHTDQAVNPGLVSRDLVGVGRGAGGRKKRGEGGGGGEGAGGKFNIWGG